MIKKQHIWILSLFSVFVVLLAVYLIFIGPMLKENQDTTVQEPPEIFDGEALSTTGLKVMMFEQVVRENIAKIEVGNSYGGYAFHSDESGTFYVTGYESAPYNQTAFSYLVTTVGYTVINERVVRNCEDMSLYGLGEGEEQGWFKVTTKNAKVHKVYIGDAIPTGGGYYVRYEGRDTVYILDNTLGVTVLADLATLITPMLSYPVSTTDGTYIEQISLFRGEELYFGAIRLTDEQIESLAATTAYMTTQPLGYQVSLTNFDTFLSTFNQFVGLRTVKVGIDKETLKEYGLDTPAFTLHYKYQNVDSYVLFSEKQEDGTYYAASSLFGLIAVVDGSVLEFLNWEWQDFIASEVFMKNINLIGEIKIEGNDVKENFLLDGTDKALTVKRGSTGEDMIVNHFRHFYITLLSIEIQGIAEVTDSEGLECLATMTVVSRDGTTMEYKFYPYSTRRCFVEINGKGQFYVYIDVIERLLENTVKVCNGEDIDYMANA